MLQYNFEALFRSEQYALVDNACREYLFVSEFFMVRGPQALELFNQIMGKTLGLLMVSYYYYYIIISIIDIIILWVLLLLLYYNNYYYY